MTCSWENLSERDFLILMVRMILVVMVPDISSEMNLEKTVTNYPSFIFVSFLLPTGN